MITTVLKKIEFTIDNIKEYYYIINIKLAINLRKIFCHITNDDNFLTTIIESKITKINNAKENCIVHAISQDHSHLPHGLIQKYHLFPLYIKKILNETYYRYGVASVTEKNLTPINISFVSSLNALLDNKFTEMEYTMQHKNTSVLEDFISNKIVGNCHVDKIKNKKNVKIQNKKLDADFRKGKICDELIQRVANIFEFNLLLFDIINSKVLFFWTHGVKYPFFNPFRDIYCMVKINENYEPILTPSSTVAEKNKIYTYILTHQNEITFKATPNYTFQIAPFTLLYINKWDLTNNEFIIIVESYFQIKKKVKLQDKIKY